MLKLLNNLPIEDLTEENDYLGIIDKGQIIKTFLESNTDEFKDIKMFALYGEWGSGKSTLMKYLQKELKGSFNTYFFEAWQYESDDNLSLSLLEYLSYETSDSTDEALGEIVEVAAKLFRGFSKSMRISVPGLSIDGSKIVESLEEKPEETFYQLKKKFQKEFESWENINTIKGKPKFNIVFIDDLDRCEPENVLNLLSALKLFFTYGEKTVFFCGVDKKAVNEAVKTKYGEVVKANEYLEKVFDISFNMPKHDDLVKLVHQYFLKEDSNEMKGKLEEEISNFFIKINFTNPRKVKKVLNKFLIIRNLKTNESNYRIDIPSIITDKGGNLLETIIVLYLIILQEFRPNLLDNMFNLDEKLKVFEKAIEQNAKKASTNNIQAHVASALSHFKAKFSYVKKVLLDNKVSLNDILKEKYFPSQEDRRKNRFVSEILFLSMIFCPTDILEMDQSSLDNHDSFQNSFRVESTQMEYYFTKYLLDFFENNNNYDDISEIPIVEYKNVIRTLF